MSASSDHDQTTSMSRPSSAGIYDYLLGGEHYLDADREAAERLNEIHPDGDMSGLVWANRGFLQRAARWLATDTEGEAGIDQFVDIGAGLPTVRNTHEIVGAGCRVAYVDHDPRAVAQGQRLLVGVPNVAYLQGNLCDPGVPDIPDLRELIDLSRPVGLLLIGLLHFIPDEQDPYGAVARLVDALPSGSYVALSHAITDRNPVERGEQVVQVYQQTREGMWFRTVEEVRRFVEGLQIVPPYAGAEPRLDYVGSWGADDPERADDDNSRIFVAAVARKP